MCAGPEDVAVLTELGVTRARSCRRDVQTRCSRREAEGGQNQLVIIPHSQSGLRGGYADLKERARERGRDRPRACCTKASDMLYVLKQHMEVL